MKHVSFRPSTALAQAVVFDDITMHVQLTDGRTVSVPLLWFPRLYAAQPEQRRRVEIGGGGRGLHWAELDEGLSVAGLLAGGRNRHFYRPARSVANTNFAVVMNKEQILETVHQLPADFELEDLFERLLFIQRLERRLKKAG